MHMGPELILQLALAWLEIVLVLVLVLVLSANRFGTRFRKALLLITIPGPDFDNSQSDVCPGSR